MSKLTDLQTTQIMQHNARMQVAGNHTAGTNIKCDEKLHFSAKLDTLKNVAFNEIFGR